MLNLFRAVWAYRGFVLGSVQREFQLKYRNSLLGAAWTVINPLAMIVVYTVIFSQVMRAKLPGVDSTFGYSIYLCAGVLTWGLFSEITLKAQSMFLDNANLLRKLNFPRICLPIMVAANALLNFGIVFGLFTFFLLVTGNFPGWAYLALLPLLGLLILFSVGLGITLGVLNVFFRDVGQFFGIFITFWFWLTPITYPVSILPKWVKPFMALNPMACFMAAFQDVLVRDEWPRWATLWPMALATLLLCAFGLRLFRRHSGEIMDEL
jgi:lipopolysaccharide transport system permease protein